MAKLSARAERLKRAGLITCGSRGWTRFAALIGISKQMMSFIINGVKPVTDDVERRASVALRREVRRMRADADELENLVAKMERELS